MRKVSAWLLVLMFFCTLCIAAMARADQNVVVVLDDSGSMEDRMRTASGRVQRIEAAKKALISVLSNLPADTNVGVLALNSEVAGSHWIVPFGPADRSVWEPNIRGIRAEGGTPLGEFLKVGADALLEARSRQIYGTYRLLVVTDGEANDERILDAYLPDVLSRGMIVDVIGVDMESDHSLATRVHNYRRADDDRALQQAISEVFAESSGTNDDANDSDFELIAGLPDGMASAALQAIVNRGNEPVGGAAGATGSFRGAAGGGSASGSAVESVLGGLLCCMSGIAAVFILAAVLLKSRKSPPRR